jgi:hypothetical protein
MEQKKTLMLMGLVLTILACNALSRPNTAVTPALVEATKPSVTLTALSENEATCRAEIVITNVDEVDMGDDTKLVHVKIGFENKGTMWAKLRGPDDDEDTETQKSVFITTKDGSVYGFRGRHQGIPPQFLPDQSLTLPEERGAVVTALIPPEFAILGQTVGGQPHYYGFAFQMPSAQVPESITMKNMSLVCLGPPTTENYSDRANDDLPQTYSLMSGITDVHALPSADKFPDLVGSKLEMEYEGESIEFTGVSRKGNTISVTFNYVNDSTYEAYPTLNGYVIGYSRLAACLATGEYNCELQESYLPTVQPGQTAQDLVWSFIVPENETNLFFVYVGGDVSDLNKVYRINTADIKEEVQVSPTETGNIGDTNPLCQNDYFPAIKGAKWIRRTTTTSENTGFTVSLYGRAEVAQILPDGFTTFVDVSSTEEFAPRENSTGSYFKYVCTDDGLTTEGVEGVFLPKEMPVGSTWTYGFPGVAELKSTALGFESVTVPAGTFDAVKVMEAANMFRWYVAGVGDVKAESYDPGTSVRSITELISYSIPK